MKENLALTSIISFVLGILLASSIEGANVATGLLFAIGSIFLCAWFFARRDWYVFPALFFLFLSLGILRYSFFDTGIRQSLEQKLGDKVEVQGTVVADPDIRESTERLTVYVPSENTKILVVASRYPSFSYGDTVTVSGKIEHPKPFDTDGGRVFAYDKFLAKDQVSYLMNFAHIKKTGEETDIVTLSIGTLYSIKGIFVTGLQEALPEPASSLAEGILVGGKQGLGKQLLDAFTTAGLLPIIVLSGYNVMIVAEAILSLFGFLKRRYALTISSMAIILFVVMAGSGSSAVRAGLMAVLALFARGTGRTYDALRILVFVFLVMLLWNPYQLVYDPGFQFSFVATLGLIVLSTPLEARFMKIKNASLREIIATTLAAQLFVLPLLLYQTGNLSLVSVPANILALIAVPPAMLFSFIAGVVGIIVPSIALWAGFPAYALLSYIICIAEFSASLPFAHVLIPEFPVVLLLLMYVAIALVARRLMRSATKLSQIAPQPRSSLGS